MSIIHGRFMQRRGSWGKVGPEGEQPPAASSSITGEGLLIRVKEGSKLNVKVLSHMDGSQQIYKSGS